MNKTFVLVGSEAGATFNVRFLVYKGGVSVNFVKVGDPTAPEAHTNYSNPATARNLWKNLVAAGYRRASAQHERFFNA